MEEKDPNISTLTQADIDAITKVFTECTAKTCGNCNTFCGVDAAQHKKHHEFINELIVGVKKWNEVKWFSLKSTFSVLTIAFVAFLLYYFFKIELPKP